MKIQVLIDKNSWAKKYQKYIKAKLSEFDKNIKFYTNHTNLKKNYEVIVLTTTPHYNQIQDSLDRQPLKKCFFGLFFTSNFNGIKVYHIPLKKNIKTL